MPESIRDAKKITLEVTPEENRSAWKKMKDKTASASQAPAFRHYKIASTDNTMNQIDADLRSIPLTVGICPEEWCKTDDVMIKKRSGSHKIRDMRLVQLCDAEFNMSNKQASREILKLAEKNNLMAEGQSGNRKRRRANLLLLNKVLLRAYYA